MPIDQLYEDSTADYLTGANQVNVPAAPPPTPSTSIGSIARAVGRGIGQGGAQLFGAAADLTAGAAQLYTDPDTAPGAALDPQAQAARDKQVNDAINAGRTGSLFESKLGTTAYDLADTLKADPTKSTAIDQVVQGAVSGLTQIVPAAVLGGPLAGAAVGAASIGTGRAEDLKREGVDVGTRTAVGSLEGGLAAAGAVLPVAGTTLARTAALVAVGGPGLGIAQGTAEKAILRNANYDHLADQIDPLDPVNLTASTLMAGFFGGVHSIATARSAKAAAADLAAQTSNTTLPIDQMSLDARKALRYDAPQLDAYATQVAQANGVPPAMLLFIKNQGERSNSNQVSPAGAKGVMQFTDPTFAKFGKGDPTDPINSIDAAGAYAKDLLQRYNGDVRAAVTEYNGGVAQAKAVHAGGAPTDPETVGYLQRYDQFAANHAIDNASFNPTPDQVDAAFSARGQQIVDEAHVFGTPDNVADMANHQAAFEAASRQMDAGQFPDVSSFVSTDDAARANALDSLINDAETARTDLAQQASGLADQGKVTQMRADLEQLQAAAPDGSDAGVKELTRQFQQQRMSYKQALAKAQKQMAADVAEHDARVQRLQSAIDENARAQQAHQQLTVLDSQLDQMRTTRAQIDAPATARTPLSRFVEDVIREQNRYVPTPRDGAPLERTVAEPVTAEAATDVGAGSGGAPRAANEPAGVPADASTALSAEGDIPNLGDIVRAALGTDEAAPRATATRTAPADPAAAAVDSNLREAAAANPDGQFTVDSTNGEQTGTIAELLQTIDDEHAMNTQDAGLFEVAANCFIRTGG